jgi:hypothetical protein
MRQYRIVEQTLGNGSCNFKIERNGEFGFNKDTWFHVTTRTSLELARKCMEDCKGYEVVSERVVE